MAGVLRFGTGGLRVRSALTPTVDIIAPIITSSTTASVAENVAFSYILEVDEPCTAAITGGADGGMFNISQINSTSFNVTMAAQNYEAPADANTDNIYVATFRATDTSGNVSLTFTLSVTVTDVAEGIGVPSGIAAWFGE